ncbi:nitroreductase family deazaflavin-dependent oxidoreductase [Galbitalea soli]|uniref:Nitroreductase family deazaflavin-dependent oxidoreductase n=1 Tax=Galbitalea soli TaxID=1268042 RepID=A0A7C9PNH7_9MICO|nr:nitroreductase family deazaflavin-dependent oxidoreductase [Galbitalea soli]NEM91674.1 nitroreductase family deazaflavin-dependent oxidoreductase [Galbitalea soli]NYJ30370.1 deazaflavin-dependent oxidoreductase (nitroreductase family) [Galbitalea soli]
MSDWNDQIIAEFRGNDGVVGGPFTGSHLVLLTTTGAKSGQQRTSPMMYFPQDAPADGPILVVASKAGADTHPGWYHNLIANPTVHVEVATAEGVVEYDATAEELPRAERDAAYVEIVKAAPGFGDYEKKTSRVIPVIRLTRVG